MLVLTFLSINMEFFYFYFFYPHINFLPARSKEVASFAPPTFVCLYDPVIVQIVVGVWTLFGFFLHGQILERIRRDSLCQSRVVYVILSTFHFVHHPNITLFKFFLSEKEMNRTIVTFRHTCQYTNQT